jgi:hypothetical protein
MENMETSATFKLAVGFGQYESGRCAHGWIRQPGCLKWQAGHVSCLAPLGGGAEQKRSYSPDWKLNRERISHQLVGGNHRKNWTCASISPARRPTIIPGPQLAQEVPRDAVLS